MYTVKTLGIRHNGSQDYVVTVGSRSYSVVHPFGSETVPVEHRLVYLMKPTRAGGVYEIACEDRQGNPVHGETAERLSGIRAAVAALETAWGI
jgi:hypothetical protein